MQAIPFNKMHGLGNDFVVVDRRSLPLALDPALIRRIGDRHRGVGFDQLIVLDPSDRATATISFYNGDGSVAGACGNGTRCAARLLMDADGSEEVTFASAAGPLSARRLPDGRISVRMAVPRLDWRDIPLAVSCDTLHVPLDVAGLPRPVGVSMGNPHAVFFVPDLTGLDVAALGQQLEHHPLFPERANIGFAQVLARDVIRLRVFERGAGLTLACGSGACAAVVAGRRRGLIDTPCRVVVDGGELEILWPDEGPVTMTGATSFSFSGFLAQELLHD